MKRLKIPSSLLIILIIAISIVGLGYDILEYYSYFTIENWEYLHEIFALTNIFLFYLFLRNRTYFTEPDVRKNLKNFIKFLAALYIVVLAAKQIFSPVFSSSTFPQRPETMASLFYSNIVSCAAILFMTPMLIIIKNLIGYKHRRRTQLYIYGALISTLICIVLTVIFQTPLNLKFSGQGIYNNAAFVIVLVFLALTATRNSWITYLSRKEKFYYFLISLIFIWVILYIFDFAFAEAVPSHSLALAVFTNTSWLFLVFYTNLASLNLLLHLPTARVFDRKMKEVTSLHHLSRAISVEFNFEKLVKMVTEMSSEVLESSLTWLEVLHEERQEVDVVASKNSLGDKLPAITRRPLENMSQQIFSEKKTLVIHDIAKSKLSNLPKEWDRIISSFVGVPLLSANGQIFGILYAAKTKTFGFDPDDVNMLEAYANQAAIAIENAALLKKSLERERMEKELQIARDVQNRLLPQQTPKVNNLQIDTLTITAYEVGGDYHDFYFQGDSSLGLVIGDVSGKGTSAAFYMAECKGIIQSLARTFCSPYDILIQANKILYESLEKKSFISLLTAQIDLNSFTVTFARAGHCPIIYYCAADHQTQSLRPDGIAVGLDAGAIFDAKLQQEIIQLRENDILAFYTDGLSEARNEHDEEYGEERFCEYIMTHAHLSVDHLKQAIIDEILRFLNGNNLHDDLTLVLIKRTKEQNGGLNERI